MTRVGSRFAGRCTRIPRVASLKQSSCSRGQRRRVGPRPPWAGADAGPRGTGARKLMRSTVPHSTAADPVSDHYRPWQGKLASIPSIALRGRTIRALRTLIERRTGVEENQNCRTKRDRRECGREHTPADLCAASQGSLSPSVRPRRAPGQLLGVAAKAHRAREASVPVASNQPATPARSTGGYLLAGYLTVSVSSATPSLSLP